MTPEQTEFELLISRYMNDEAGPEDIAALARWMESSPDNARTFAEWSRLDYGLGYQVERRALPSHELTQPPAQQWSQAALRLAVAACILVPFGFLAWRQTRSEAARGGIARVAYTKNVRWSGGASVAGGEMVSGEIELDSGIVKLALRNGVEVTLEGPASFEIKGKHRAQLHHGLLAARVPEKAIGFQINTPTMNLIDLGTSFGVMVDPAGPTDISVFEGAVRVRSEGGYSAVVNEGQAAQSGDDRSTFRIRDYDARVYERVWPVALGVTGATGSVRVVRPGPPWDLTKHRDDNQLTLFPEVSRVRLHDEIQVDAMGAGEVRRGKDQLSRTIPSGKAVRSYLLQFNATPKQDRAKAAEVILDGQIEFAVPIVGVIWTTDRLKTTDALFGAEGARYRSPSKRGLEIREEMSPDKGDLLTISKDRRTLAIRIICKSGLDHVRILVDAGP
ncbi:MAG: FecR domain-containing protein [Planctomycetota bacterium]